MSNTAFIPTQLVVQLDNNIQPPQWGAPVILGGVTLILDQAGNTMYQPAYVQRPVSAADITPDILQATNNQLAAIGLKLERVEA